MIRRYLALIQDPKGYPPADQTVDENLAAPLMLSVVREEDFKHALDALDAAETELAQLRRRDDTLPTVAHLDARRLLRDEGRRNGVGIF